MQFVANGPDIPDQLLQQHEDGNVVFFCGAGISAPAGLPMFDGLVTSVYSAIGDEPDELECTAITEKQFDVALDLLERRLQGGRNAVRTAVFTALQPNLRPKAARDTHRALLELARDRHGATRLVTTNFDRIFERLTRGQKRRPHAYCAPQLPIAKRSRWDGIVYLHGLLPDEERDSELSKLVLTSGDFGLAYLTERWASRFVTDLFQNYVVCFIGYGLNDPVLRYMLDALAADRRLGETTPVAYVLASCQPGAEVKETARWNARGVAPILYETQIGPNGHAMLHSTLHAWASTYKDGAWGKERIVVAHALTVPSQSTTQDDFLGRMLWAISDDSAAPAERFALHDPVPSLEWLAAFESKRFAHGDLGRFGVRVDEDANVSLAFSLTDRPAHYSLSPTMSLASHPGEATRWDRIMHALSRWLVRHLDDPALLVWILRAARTIHPDLADTIRYQLAHVAKLTVDGELATLQAMQTSAPRSIPSKSMLTLWHLLLADRIAQEADSFEISDWVQYTKSHGTASVSRLRLLDLLAPKLKLTSPRVADFSPNTPALNASDLHFEIAISSSGIEQLFVERDQLPGWREMLPHLAGDVCRLLRDALDLLREINHASEYHDSSAWELPSIEPHWQNQYPSDFASLIELARDSWIALLDDDPGDARAMARKWFDIPYPAFKRLALYAATFPAARLVAPAIELLHSNDGWWLWSSCTRREVCRLLASPEVSVPAEHLRSLEARIMHGPPRRMYVEDIGSEEWSELADYAVWLRLTKLAAGASDLCVAAQTQLARICQQHPEWRVSSHMREEFSSWGSGTGDPDFEEEHVVVPAPTRRDQLREWLLRKRANDERDDDEWRVRCADQLEDSAVALLDLAVDDQWPIERWRDALAVWSDRQLAPRTWGMLAPTVAGMPDAMLRELAHAVAWWLDAVAPQMHSHEAEFWALCDRLLRAEHEPGITTPNRFGQAIHHPIGHVTSAVLRVSFREPRVAGQQLSAEARERLTTIADTSQTRLRLGRVIIASSIAKLYELDPEWTRMHVLPAFEWEHSTDEAAAAWSGFLAAPHMPRQLLSELQGAFLAVASHTNELSDYHRKRYAFVLTYACLDATELLTRAQARAAFRQLPQAVLDHAALALVNALDSTGPQREEYWTHRIAPFWKSVWPKDRSMASDAISLHLARLVIAARGKMREALHLVAPWLSPIPYLGMVLHELDTAGLCASQPEAALELMDRIIGSGSFVSPTVQERLLTIGTALPHLLDTPAFRRLKSLRGRQ
jgi:SIR2-like domain